MSTEIPSIAVPSKKSKTIVKAVVAANAVITEPRKLDQSLRLILFSPLDKTNELELKFTPIPYKNGTRLSFHRYNGNGSEGYTNDDMLDTEALAELRMCLILQAPTSVSFSYKSLTYFWKAHDVLTQISVKQKLFRKLNDHDCECDDCDPDRHDLNETDFYDHIINTVSVTISQPMKDDGKNLYLMKELEGKECPVLLEPLRVGYSIRLSCHHYMSREAWEKTKSDGSIKRCPLCRANGHEGGHWEYL